MQTISFETCTWTQSSWLEVKLQQHPECFWTYQHYSMNAHRILLTAYWQLFSYIVSAVFLYIFNDFSVNVNNIL